MAVKKIYIVRHGQTKFNDLGIVQGRGVDASLNDNGKQQAELFYDYYKDVPFQHILISTLKRTYESVEKFIDDGIPYTSHEGLDEISWGVHEGAEASELRNRYFRNMVESWKNGNTDHQIEGGESPRDMQRRQEEGLRKLLEREHEKQLLLCMHGRAMRSFLCLLTGQDLCNMDTFKHSNLCLYVVEQNGEKFDIVEWNSVDHLWI